MQINITVRQLGKKHPYLKDVPIELSHLESEPTLREFLLAVVAQQVDAFNTRKLQKTALPFLTQKAIAQQANTGKVSFGESYNDNLADLDQAKTRMLEAFEDGLFAVFQGEERLELLESKLSLGEDESFTFMRLAFLAGTYY